MNSLHSGVWTPNRWTPGSTLPARRDDVSAETQLLQALMRLPGDSDIGQQMQAAALHLAFFSGWRWAAVARMVDGGQAGQLLAFVDRQRVLNGHTYELSNAPCKAVVDGDGVVHIDSVVERYVEDAVLAEMGVLHYTGLAIRQGNEPVGHVFLMHDQALSASQAHLADRLLQLATLHVGHRLELHGVRSQALEWQRRAETDALTQLPNRHAFERELALQQSMIRSGARADMGFSFGGGWCAPSPGLQADVMGQRAHAAGEVRQCLDRDREHHLKGLLGAVAGRLESGPFRVTDSAALLKRRSRELPQRLDARVRQRGAFAQGLQPLRRHAQGVRDGRVPCHAVGCTVVVVGFHHHHLALQGGELGVGELVPQGHVGPQGRLA